MYWLTDVSVLYVVFLPYYYSIGPVVRVFQEKFGIVHGCITTIHDVTGTQTIVDMPNEKKSDLVGTNYISVFVRLKCIGLYLHYIFGILINPQ